MQGQITKFIEKKSFGFLKGEDNKDYFFHLSEVHKPLKISNNLKVTFDPSSNTKGLVAKNIMEHKAQSKKDLQMIGTVVKLITKSKFGFIKSTSDEEFYFKFEDFKFEKDLIDLTLDDTVKFNVKKATKGKNKIASSLYKIVNIQDILTNYPISLESIIQISQQIGIESNLTEHSYISQVDFQKILDTFYTLNNQKANTNNPNYKNNPTVFEKLIKDNYLIFLDTSSLMNFNALKVLQNEIIPYLKKYKKRLYVVELVLKEIQRNEKSSHPATAKQAKSATYVLNALAKDDLYAIPDTNSVETRIADQELITSFTNYRVKYDLCLITNDNSHKKGGKLAQGIMNLKNDINVKHTKDIVVYSINHDKKHPKLVKYESIEKDTPSLDIYKPKRVKL